MAGTATLPFLEDANARMFGSVRSVTSTAVASLEYVALRSDPQFSIRQWVRSGTGSLFILYDATQIATLRSLISAWMRITIFEAMTRGEDDDRLWFALNELDVLGPVDGLKDAHARLRKFGGRCLLGLQSIAQISGLYGPAESQTIVENCGNTLILRCSASANGGTARFASRLIREREIVRKIISSSHGSGAGAHSHSSRSRTRLHVTESAVLVSGVAARQARGAAVLAARATPVEVIQRIAGWMPGSVEHSVIRVVEEGIEMEGVVRGGLLEEPFAIRYAVTAHPDGRCRGITARAIGKPILIEILADGKGRWTDDDVLIRGLDGALDVDLGITPVAHALTIRRLALGIGESAEVSVAGIDLLGGEIRFDARKFTRLGENHYRVHHLATAVATELRCEPSSWALKILPRRKAAVTS